MAILHLNESSSGATRLSGTNGDLNAFLKWALVTNGGWTNPFTTTNADIFVAPSGNKFPLFVNHDSANSGNAGLAVVRGCESATAAAAASLINPFPTVAQAGATVSNTIVSTAASTTTRNFDIYIGPSFFYLFVNSGGSTNIWDFFFYGDFSPVIAADTWATAISIRNTSSAGAGVWPVPFGSGGVATNQIYIVRSIDGSVNSTHSGFTATTSASIFGICTDAATMQNGPTGLIDRRKVAVGCSGSSTTTFTSAKGLYVRGYLPQLWEPIHSGLGAVNSRDTFTDTAYNGSATFQVFSAATGNAANAIIEQTATWNPPAA